MEPSRRNCYSNIWREEIKFKILKTNMMAAIQQSHTMSHASVLEQRSDMKCPMDFFSGIKLSSIFLVWNVKNKNPTMRASKDTEFTMWKSEGNCPKMSILCAVLHSESEALIVGFSFLTFHTRYIGLSSIPLKKFMGHFM